ncbi:MAG: 50S ribosomal protein L9, partial [Nitrospinota bacterium]
MRVILKQDIPALGRAGTIVEVSKGYGRNYLLPKGLAVPATPSNEKQFLYLQKVRSDKLLREKSEAEAFA